MSRTSRVDTELHLAASAGNLSKVQELISAGADLEARTVSTGFTALHCAVTSEEREILEEQGLTCLIQARLLQLDVVRALLDGGADTEARDEYGGTPLHWAIEFPKLVSLLLRRGANVDAADRYGCTPLHYACRDGHQSTVKRLLARGAAIYATDKYGVTPLHKTASNPTLDIAKLLIQKVEDLIKEDEEDVCVREAKLRAFVNTRVVNTTSWDQGIPGHGSTLLHLMIQKGAKRHMVKELCDLGACARLKTPKCRTFSKEQQVEVTQYTTTRYLKTLPGLFTSRSAHSVEVKQT